ncbi:MAG: HNH endonuclease [candidate division WOR-3 bacterium]
MKEREENKKRITEIYEGECANREDERFFHDGKMTVHHIVFKRDGGTDEKGNLILLCKECHNYVHFLAEEKENGKGTGNKNRRNF